MATWPIPNQAKLVPLVALPVHPILCFLFSHLAGNWKAANRIRPKNNTRAHALKKH